MKLAYSDPPYIGQAKRHYSHDPSGIPAEEVDHKELIGRMVQDYDGWALSTSSPALFEIIHMYPLSFWQEHNVRIGAWVKPFSSWKPTHRVQYCWEPVIFTPTRPKGSKSIPSVRDFVSANITMRRGTHGAKPDAFCDWALNVMGYQPGDIVTDMFPGSGAFTQAIERALDQKQEK